MAGLTITVGGADITAYVDVHSISIEEVGTEIVATCRFRVRDHGSTVDIDTKDVVDIDDDGTTIFAGEVAQVDDGQEGVAQTLLVICHDTNILIDETVIESESYTAGTADAAILADLFSTYRSDINATTHVATLNASMEAVAFAAMTLREILDDLASRTGARYYVDYAKNLHWFATEANNAAFSLSTSPNMSSSFPFGGFGRVRSAARIAEKVYVLGKEVSGWYPSGAPSYDGSARHAVSRDQRILTADAVEDRGKAIYDQYSSERVTYRLWTERDGLRAGQSVTVVNATWSINGAFYIRRVRVEFVGADGETRRYHLELNDESPDPGRARRQQQLQVSRLETEVNSVGDAVFDTDAPAAPTALGAGNVTTGVSEDADGKQLVWAEITWSEVSDSDLDHYELQISTAADFSSDLATRLHQGGGDRRERFAGLVGNTTYYVRVRAADWVGNTSAWDYGGGSAYYFTSAKDSTPPAVVSSLSATATPVSVHLYWSPNSEADFSHYQVQRKPDSGAYAALATCHLNFLIDVTVVIGTTYWYQVRAVDSSGNASAYVESPSAVGPAQIVSGEITDLAIIEGKLAANAVTLNKIKDGAVDTDKIAALAVEAAKIGAKAVETGKIADSAVDTLQLAALAVETAKIANNAVDTLQIANLAVEAGQIGLQAVETAKIKLRAVEAAQIGDNVITADQILANTITATEIAALTITAAEIKAGTITGAKVAADTIESGNIKALTIEAGDIKGNTITAAEIAALTITAAEIAAATITGGKIAADTIESGNIKALTIEASDIKAGTITGAKVAADTIESGNIKALTIEAGDIKGNTITAAEIAALTITAAEIAAATITGGKIAALTIEAGNIKGDTITASEIAANAIGASEIAANVITAAHIAANTITAAEIAATTITTTEIAANTIVAGNMNVSTLSAITANMGLLTAGEIRVGTGTVGSNFTGFRIMSSYIGGYDGDVLQAGIQSSDGAFVAGGGAVTMDAGGIALAVGTGTVNKIRWNSGASTVVQVYGYQVANAGYGFIDVTSLAAATSAHSSIRALSYRGSYDSAEVKAVSGSSGGEGQIDLSIDGSAIISVTEAKILFSTYLDVADNWVDFDTRATEPAVPAAGDIRLFGLDSKVVGANTFYDVLCSKWSDGTVSVIAYRTFS